MSPALVYQLRTTDDLNRDPVARAEIGAFLVAHGIDPNRFLVGTTLYVRRHADETLWLYTREARKDWPLCPHCEDCVRTDEVVVPLLSLPPLPQIAFIVPDPGRPT